MIADTTFLIDLMDERESGRPGPALAFLARHRKGALIRTTIINLGEISVAFPSSRATWEYFQKWTVYRLTPAIADSASDVDRELIRSGGRLGENDNWIAGFGRYYREPIISRDTAFDRVPGVRRIGY